MTVSLMQTLFNNFRGPLERRSNLVNMVWLQTLQGGHSCSSSGALTTGTEQQGTSGPLQGLANPPPTTNSPHPTPPPQRVVWSVPYSLPFHRHGRHPSCGPEVALLTQELSS